MSQYGANEENGEHDKINPLAEEVTKIMSAADEPVLLTKDSSCYNKNTILSGYHLSTRKGSRSTLMEQNSKDMDQYLHELLKDIDRRIKPRIEDDDVGGKWIQNIYCSTTYNIECLIFHLTPNRSLDYLEDFYEIPGYEAICNKNHDILAAILDATCCNKETCTYKTIFFPHVNKPGPIFLPESIRILLEDRRHGLNLGTATAIVDLLCSYFIPVLDQLDLKTKDGDKITTTSMEYQSDNIIELASDFENIKWAYNFCICCILLKQMKIGIKAGSGNWITNGTGISKDKPLEVLTLLGYENYIDKNVKPDINCFSNCININGYKMSSFIDPLSIFNQYNICLIGSSSKGEPQYCVSLKLP